MSLVNERSRDCGIHAARERAQYFLVADLRFEFRDRGFGEVRHRPLALGAADLVKEVFKNGVSERRVHDFGVKLHAVEVLFRVSHSGYRASRGGRGDGKTGRHFLDVTSVAHPALRIGRNILEQRRIFHRHDLLAVLSGTYAHFSAG